MPGFFTSEGSRATDRVFPMLATQRKARLVRRAFDDCRGQEAQAGIFSSASVGSRRT